MQAPPWLVSPRVIFSNTGHRFPIVTYPRRMLNSRSSALYTAIKLSINHDFLGIGGGREAGAAGAGGGLGSVVCVRVDGGRGVEVRRRRRRGREESNGKLRRGFPRLWPIVRITFSRYFRKNVSRPRFHNYNRAL
jgi:hypothetical protein